MFIYILVCAIAKELLFINCVYGSLIEIIRKSNESNQWVKESEVLVEWYWQRNTEVRREARAWWYLVQNEIWIFRPVLKSGFRDDRRTTKTA
jgi:hypothetical protein